MKIQELEGFSCDYINTHHLLLLNDWIFWAAIGQGGYMIMKIQEVEEFSFDYINTRHLVLNDWTFWVGFSSLF